MQVPSISPETGEMLGTRSVPAAHLNQSVTRIEFADYIDDDDFIALTRSTDNDRKPALMTRQLPEELDPWVVPLNEAEQVWASHAHTGKPAWVASDDAGLEEALA